MLSICIVVGHLAMLYSLTYETGSMPIHRRRSRKFFFFEGYYIVRNIIIEFVRGARLHYGINYTHI